MGTFIILLAGFFIGLVLSSEGWVLELPTFVKRASHATANAISVSRSMLAPAIAHASGEAAALKNSPALLRISAPNGKKATRIKKRKRPEKASDGSTKTESGENDSGQIPIQLTSAPDPRWMGNLKTRTTRGENWPLPSLTLLEDPQYNFSARQESVVREKGKVLERTLEEFRLDAHVVEIDTGPVITMFELKLAPGIKVSQIASLSNDIARALKAPMIRVVAPIPGKNTVGIEVPNVEKEKVRLKELMLLAGEKAHQMNLPLFIGKDAAGATIITDLTHAPHMLIAGTTGSGKSVCLNSIIVSLLMSKSPDQVKLILIDPKMVEMNSFKDVPHLMYPIVTNMNQAQKILQWAVTKMEQRYEFLAKAGVRNIAAFNKMAKKEIQRRLQPSEGKEKKTLPTHLPYIVVIIDELADLMMTCAKEVEHHLSRLSQKSRAVGIHIVVATQRPEAKVVTGLIKSNLPCRIAFRVASRLDSRIVLDQNGGEVLMGEGDMLFLPPGSHKLIRAQGTFLEDHEVHAVVADTVSRARPQFSPELMRMASNLETKE